MKKMTFILMIMAACLASAAFAVAPADITNASFEDDTIAAGIADYWTLWGENQSGLVYHFGDAVNANTGNDYFEISLGGGGWAGIHPDLGQEVGVTAGSEVEFVAWAKTADGAEATGAVALKFEFYATNGEGWVEGATPNAEITFDLVAGGYQRISHATPVPAGMFFARATVVGSADTSVFVDDVWIGLEGTDPGLAGPFAPIPGNGVIVSRTAPDPPTAVVT